MFKINIKSPEPATLKAFLLIGAVMDVIFLIANLRNYIKEPDKNIKKKLRNACIELSIYLILSVFFIAIIA